MDRERIRELGAMLPEQMLIEPLPLESPAQAVDRLVRMAEAALTASPRRSAALRAADRVPVGGIDARQYESMIRRIVGTVRGDNPALVADPGDAVVVDRLDPPLVRTTAQAWFETTVRLRNAGGVRWHGRLLLRLGPLTTSTIALTPPLLPVPDTAPGETCEIRIPGRTQYLPCMCVVHYIMIFPDGGLCLPGGLSITVSVQGGRFRTRTLPAPIVALIRAVRGRG